MSSRTDLDTLEELRNGDDTRTISEMKAADRDFEESTIKEVTPYDDGTGWSILREDSIGFGLERVEGKPEPKVGDEVRVYGLFGFPFYGVDLNGEEVFWRTPWERFSKRVEWLAEYDRKKREEFEESKDSRDAEFDALPEPLRNRIQRFRDEDPTFRIDSEGYELFCCTEAAAFFEAAKLAAASEEYEEEIDAFWALPIGPRYTDGVREQGTVFEKEPETQQERFLIWAWALNSAALGYDYEKQKAVLGSSDGHSGNTFGGSISMALALVRGENV